MGKLILTRKQYEEILIDEAIVISVAEIRGDKVRLSVDAPPEFRVYRRELLDLIKQENGEPLKQTNPVRWRLRGMQKSAGALRSIFKDITPAHLEKMDIDLTLLAETQKNIDKLCTVVNERLAG